MITISGAGICYMGALCCVFGGFLVVFMIMALKAVNGENRLVAEELKREEERVRLLTESLKAQQEMNRLIKEALG